jgi:hypothetical protein
VRSPVFIPNNNAPLVFQTLQFVAARSAMTFFQGFSPSVSINDDPRKLQIEVLQPDAASHALYASALLRQEELYSAIYGERRI